VEASPLFGRQQEDVISEPVILTISRNPQNGLPTFSEGFQKLIVAMEFSMMWD
jgi:hypothetical protein